MSELKFACPHCQQHISADAGYAGIQINCPACNGSLVVPGQVAPVPAPVPIPMPAQSSVAATPALTPPRAAASSGCPSCGSALPRGAVLCTVCGYNLATGQRTVAGRPAALGKPASTQWEAPWYKTPYPYLGLVVAIMATLYFLGRSSPPLMVAFIGAGLLYTLVVHIIVIVAAFRESVGTGFLTLCLPFYALYFVFKVNDDDNLKILYGVAVVINISLRVLSKLD